MPVATIGAPVPDNLEAMTLEEIHALHSSIWAERTALKLKHASILPVLHVKQLQRDMETRAGFDTILKVGPKRFTLAKAQQYLADAKEGLVGLPADMAARLKRIIDSGKDEQ